MKRVLSIVLALTLLFSLMTVYTVSSASYHLGDVNDDGLVNAIDSNLISKFVVGIGIIDDTRCADLNFDGKVNAADLNLMKRVFTGSHQLVQPTEEGDISLYTVVYPKDATVYEVYAAEILCDYVSDNYNVSLAMVPDSTAETEYEILIGNTNREESATGAEFANNQYLLKADDKKLVLQGKDYMIGGAVGELTYNCMDEEVVLLDSIATENVIRDYAPVKGNSVTLMIGDGMGFNHIGFTKFFKRTDPTFEGFIAESFPEKGECITFCLSDPTADFRFGKITTDSAAAATALSTGWKTQKGFLGMNGYGMEIKNIREYAHDLGFKTAVVSTEGTTGATPSGFTVHTDSRANADDIISQQAALVENGLITYLKGESHDNLLADTKTALDLVSTDSEGYFVMIEEAYIDKASHKLASEYTREDLVGYVLRFNTAIQYAATFTASRPDSILIVTADHETGSLTVQGGYDAGGNHSNVNVPVFAMGYGCEMFNGTTVDNTDIADFMASVYGIESFGGDYTYKD